MKFNGGIEFNTSDMYRIEYRDGLWFVVGKGEEYLATSEEDAKNILSNLT